MSRTEQINLASTRLGLSKTKGCINMKKKADKTKKAMRRKHILNARFLEKERSLKAFQLHVNSWLAANQPQCSSDEINELIQVLKNMLKLMGYKLDQDLLSTCIIYAERYVKLEGAITQGQLFHLLLIAALVSVKMWQDAGVDMELCSFVVGLPKKEISKMERRFLGILEWELFLDKKDIELLLLHSEVIPAC